MHIKCKVIYQLLCFHFPARLPQFSLCFWLSLTLSHNHPCTFSPKWHTKSKVHRIQGLIILGGMWHTVTHRIQGLNVTYHAWCMWHTVTPRIQGLNVTYHSWCMWHTVTPRIQGLNVTYHAWCMWHTVTPRIQGLNVTYHSWCMWHTVTPRIQGLNVTNHSWCMWHTVTPRIQGLNIMCYSWVHVRRWPSVLVLISMSWTQEHHQAEQVRGLCVQTFSCTAMHIVPCLSVYIMQFPLM